MKFKLTYQLDGMDCGPACLKMISDHFGGNWTLQKLREKSHITKAGVSLEGISDAAESIGLRSIAVKIPLIKNTENPGLEGFPLPCIAYWKQNHFVVIYKIRSQFVWIADPAHGNIKLTRDQFEKYWRNDGDKGVVLGLEPSPDFYQSIVPQESRSPNSWGSLLQYLKPYKKLIIQFLFGILVGIAFQIMLPFLTQSLIDVGVQNQNLNFITLILIAQLVLFLSQTYVQFIQSWIILQIGKRINANLISDFLSKLMKLPLGFFDSKNIGDLVQRINDNYRIEQFLTGSILNIFFSFLSLIVFSVVLLIFNISIFLIFITFSFLYVGWILFFLKRRAKIDYMNFQQNSDNQHVLYEMVNGMQEIKLQGSERKRRWKWLDVQAISFRVQSKALALRQVQDLGAIFFIRIKDIIISFLAARAVINGEISLGTLVAIQYIVGQLNAPFDQFIQFIRSGQDAKLSLNRLSEIIQVDTEEGQDDSKITNILPYQDIKLENVSFKYTSIGPWVLNDISINIPYGKTTAIVGVSGSGKTTLLKLILGFYKTTTGRLCIGDQPLDHINKANWRNRCGTVMQDNFIFSDTIASNISESDNLIDYAKLDNAVRIANIHDFVHSLPLTYNTLIGMKGLGVSQGQRQRLVIARAVYKNPDYIFFDEATNSLDATNERTIMQNLGRFFNKKTVVIVAHRLSTVKNADQIIVLDKGKVVETGTHSTLLEKKNIYYELVRDQLELEGAEMNSNGSNIQIMP